MAGRELTCRYVRADRNTGGGPWRSLPPSGKETELEAGRHVGQGTVTGRMDIPSALLWLTRRSGSATGDGHNCG